MTCRLFIYKSSVICLFQGCAIDQNLQDLFELVMGLQVGIEGLVLSPVTGKEEPFVRFLQSELNSNAPVSSYLELP